MAPAGYIARRLLRSCQRNSSFLEQPADGIEQLGILVGLAEIVVDAELDRARAYCRKAYALDDGPFNRVLYACYLARDDQKEAALALLASGAAAAEPVNVELGIFVVDVMAIDELASTFEIEIDVISRFQADARAFEPGIYNMLRRGRCFVLMKLPLRTGRPP